MQKKLHCILKYHERCQSIPGMLTSTLVLKSSLLGLGYRKPGLGLKYGALKDSGKPELWLYAVRTDANSELLI